LSYFYHARCAWFFISIAKKSNSVSSDKKYNLDLRDELSGMISEIDWILTILSQFIPRSIDIPSKITSLWVYQWWFSAVDIVLIKHQMAFSF